MSPPERPHEDAALQDLLELLSRRHCLPLVWELRGGPQSFSVLVRSVGATQPGASQRLRELREAGLVEVDEAGDYRLTPTGRRLQGVLEPAADFASAWARLTFRQRQPRGSSIHGRGEP